jgi:hypothetical protein
MILLKILYYFELRSNFKTHFIVLLTDNIHINKRAITEKV